MSVGVTKIDSYAFYGCENLKNIFYKGTAKNWAEILIDNHGNINLLGNVISVIMLQFWNAAAPIEVTGNPLYSSAIVIFESVRISYADL